MTDKRNDSAITRWAIRFTKEEDLPVLPLNGEKACRVKFSERSKNTDIVRGWFNRETEDGSAVGLPTGYETRLIVVDCDVPKDKAGNRAAGETGDEQFRTLCARNKDVPSPVRQESPSGGIHYFYAWRENVPSASKLVLGGVQTHIDTRSDQAYITMAAADMSLDEFRLGKLDQSRPYPNGYKRIPLPDGRIPKLSEAPPFPEWLYRLIHDRKISGEEADGCLAAGLSRIRNAQEGNRNSVLNRVVWSLARFFCADEAMLKKIAAKATDVAVERGLPLAEVERTVESGLRAGKELGLREGRGIEPWRVLKGGEERGQHRDEGGKENPYQGSLPPFPVTALPWRLRMIVEKGSEGIGVPVEMVFGALLGLGSACIGGARGVSYISEIKWLELANLFILIIAETGTGKSPTERFVFGHLRSIEMMFKKQWRKNRKLYERAVREINKKSDSKVSLPPPPVNTQYILDDSTMEAAIERLDDNPRGLFWNVDEMSGWFESLDRYNRNGGGEAKKKLLSAWDSRQINYARKTNLGVANEITIKRGTMGIYGNIQPELITDLFTKNDLKQGWPQRFVYIRARRFRPQSYPPPSINLAVSPLLAIMTENMLFGLSMLQSPEGDFVEPAYIRFSKGAWTLLNDYMNHLSDGCFATPFQNYTPKANRILMRLALILHYLDWASSFQCSYDIEGAGKEYERRIEAALGEAGSRQPGMPAARKREKEWVEGRLGENPEEGETAFPEPMTDGRIPDAHESIGAARKDGEASIWMPPEVEMPRDNTEISASTMDAAIRIMDWLLVNTQWVQDAIPGFGEKGSRTKTETGTAETLVAGIIAKHAQEIASLEYSVPNDTWKAWLRAENVSINKHAISGIMKRLGAESWRTGFARGRKFPPEMIEECIKMVRPKDTWLNGEEGDDD